MRLSVFLDISEPSLQILFKWQASLLFNSNQWPVVNLTNTIYQVLFTKYHLSCLTVFPCLLTNGRKNISWCKEIFNTKLLERLLGQTHRQFTISKRPLWQMWTKHTFIKDLLPIATFVFSSYRIICHSVGIVHI